MTTPYCASYVRVLTLRARVSWGITEIRARVRNTVHRASWGIFCPIGHQLYDQEDLALALGIAILPVCCRSSLQVFCLFDASQPNRSNLKQ